MSLGIYTKFSSEQKKATGRRNPEKVRDCCEFFFIYPPD